MFKNVVRVLMGAVAATICLWAGLTAYNFVVVMQQFGGVLNNIIPMIQYPGETLGIIQMSFYNSLADVGYTYHDLGMTGPYVLLYALAITVYALFKIQQDQ